MKKQVLTMALGLALTVAAAGAAFAAAPSQGVMLNSLEKGAVLGTEVKDKVMSISDTDINSVSEGKKDIISYAVLNENDSLQGAAVEEKVKPVTADLGQSIATLTDQDRLGGIVQDKENKAEGTTENMKSETKFEILEDRRQMGALVQDSVKDVK